VRASRASRSRSFSGSSVGARKILLSSNWLQKVGDFLEPKNGQTSAVLNEMHLDTLNSALHTCTLRPQPDIHLMRSAGHGAWHDALINLYRSPIGI
jgi:hypothetical protein